MDHFLARFFDNALTGIVVLIMFAALCYKCYPREHGYTQADANALRMLTANAVAASVMTPAAAKGMIYLYGY